MVFGVRVPGFRRSGFGVWGSGSFGLRGRVFLGFRAV